MTVGAGIASAAPSGPRTIIWAKLGLISSLNSSSTLGGIAASTAPSGGGADQLGVCPGGSCRTQKYEGCDHDGDKGEGDPAERFDGHGHCPIISDRLTCT